MRRLNLICAWAAFFTISIGISMGVVADFGDRKLPDGLNSPVLAMELLRKDQGDLTAILGPLGQPSDDRRQMAQQVYLDMPFILAYTALFVLVGRLLHKTGNPLAGILVVVLAIAAAIFDLLENLAILGMIGASDGNPVFHWLTEKTIIDSAPRLWSVIKWALVFLLLFPLALIYFDRRLPALRRWIGYLAGGVTLATSTVGLFGIVFGTDASIEIAAGLMGLGLFLGFVFFATYSWLANGLLPALDKLADSPCLRGLTNWPSDEDEPARAKNEQKSDKA